MNKDTALANIEEAERRLAAVETPTEAAEIADAAQAAAVFAKRSQQTVPVINKALRIKLGAERKAGELLAAMDGKGEHGGNRRSSCTVQLETLGIGKTQSSRWQSLAKVPDDDWAGFIASDDKELTSNAAYKLAKKFKPADDVKTPERKDGIVTDLAELSGQKFGTIYADPPWRYDNQGTRAATDNHYDTMSVDDICEMPVGELAEDKAHIHLWTTNAFLFDCPRILDAWGFEFRSTFVWVKPQMGIGNYWRNSHEIMVLGIRGGQTGISKSEMSWVECRRGRHSAKPDQVRSSIERLSPGPFLELFGRRAIPGWVVFGNQVIQELV
jgi:N6-adenosine-specific RNA methylase IME4